MRRKSFISTIIEFMVGVLVTILLIGGMSWALSMFWNNVVLLGFPSLPCTNTFQVSIIVISFYIVKTISKWW